MAIRRIIFKVRLTPKELTRLSTMCAHAGITKSKAIRGALDRQLSIGFIIEPRRTDKKIQVSFSIYPRHMHLIRQHAEWNQLSMNDAFLELLQRPDIL